MLVSAIMSIYNTEEQWLRQAIDSILGQTLRDLEFILILDCPTDDSAAVAEEYARRDERVRIIKNTVNMGLTKSLNRGLEAARGKYIARMDSDDISLPNRFETQVRYLEEHPDVAAVGCRCSTTNTSIPVLNDWVADREIRRIRMLFRNAGLPHPTAMIRRSVLADHGIRYTEWVKKSQDYKLWVDILPYGDLILLPDILFIYREHGAQVSANGASLSYAHQIAVAQAEALLGEMSEQEKAFHGTATEIELPDQDAAGFARYLDRLLAANRKKNLYDQKMLERELDYMWCQKAFRRLKLVHKADMALSFRTLRMLRPDLIRYTKENKLRTSQYIQAVDQFKKTAQAAYLQA